jgi:hypothetical protein
MSSEPPDPISGLLAMMAMLREVYVSAVEAEFSEEEAMQIVRTIVATAMKKQPD